MGGADAGARPGGGGRVQAELPGRPVLQILLQAQDLALHRLLVHQLDAHKCTVLLHSSNALMHACSTTSASKSAVHTLDVEIRSTPGASSMKINGSETVYQLPPFRRTSQSS